MYDKGILSEKVAADIRAMIVEKDLKPGDQLPNEIELTGVLNVSRSTVREAIKILVSTSVLEVRRGRGTFVCENPGIHKDPLGLDFMEEDDLLNYFFEMRLIIEPKMIRLAVERGSDDELDRIHQAYIEVEHKIDQGLDHSEADIQFHNAIAKACHNPIMERVIPIINDGIIGGYTKTKNNPESSKTVRKQHSQIMDAILSRDIEKAESAMMEHINYGLKRSSNK